MKQNLQELFSLCRTLAPQQIQDDSRKVKKGDLFVATQGQTANILKSIEEACQKNIVALVVENKNLIPSSFKGKTFIVPSTRKIKPLLLNQYYNFPSEKMFCVGITGTNGKTTTSFLIEHLFQKLSWKTGVIGTINHHTDTETWSTRLTTPGSVEIQKRLSDFYQRKVQSVVIEVSSIGLEQYRVDGIDFNLVLFTNFNQDHLDYHKDMKSYLNAKKILFQKGRFSNHCVALLNRDEETIDEFSKEIQIPFFTYGQKENSHFKYKILKETLEGLEIELLYKNKPYKLNIPLIGDYNASNTVAAVASVILAGFSPSRISEHLPSFKGVSGRLNRTHPSRFVFIDYAHNPHALEQVLSSLRKSKNSDQKMITVFGCGGDRDTGKRSQMGRVAQMYSDFIVLTSDNPRNENPDKIIQDIQKGIKTDKVFICPQREEGIKKGIELSRKQDIVLIAGKGHEKFQIIKDQKIPFDDLKVAQKFLKN